MSASFLVLSAVILALASFLCSGDVQVFVALVSLVCGLGAWYLRHAEAKRNER